MIPLDYLLPRLDKIMAEIPAIITADSAMAESSKARISRLYDTLLILCEELQETQKKGPEA